MERVAELNLQELNEEVRPYRIVGWAGGLWAIEYLDVDDPNDYEYAYTMNPQGVNSMREEGWEIHYLSHTDSGVIFNLRRLLDV